MTSPTATISIDSKRYRVAMREALCPRCMMALTEADVEAEACTNCGLKAGPKKEAA